LLLDFLKVLGVPNDSGIHLRGSAILTTPPKETCVGIRHDFVLNQKARECEELGITCSVAVVIPANARHLSVLFRPSRAFRHYPPGRFYFSDVFSRVVLTHVEPLVFDSLLGYF
jgi:hypothetical protein